MYDKKRVLIDCVYTVFILVAAFGVNLLLQELFETQTMIPMIFVLGVFLVSWRTQGYIWGIAASLISVLAVNYAFTYPYWAFDLISPECISSAVVMLVVAIMTGALTTQIKTQQKMKAEAEKERMRGNLLRAVSHDLRTPLTSIYGACSVIVDNYDEITKERQLKLLKDIQNDAQWLVRMVENLLSVTRIDGGKAHIEKHDTVLEELIDAVLVRFRKHYPNIEVRIQIPDGFVSIPMDAMLIEQVLINLLENAVFHAEGMTELWLIAEEKDNYVVFRVLDNGCGVPKDRLEDLFSGTSIGGGTQNDSGRSNMGIGLSVCNAIIKAHGGEIYAKNRSEGGAEFGFALETEEKTNV